MIDANELAKSLIHQWQRPNPEKDNLNCDTLEAIQKLIHSHPQDVLHTMDAIVEKTTDKHVLAQLGAGPLEDFLGSDSGGLYAADIISRARKNSDWRFALGCVWTEGFPNRQVAQQIEPLERAIYLWL